MSTLGIRLRELRLAKGVSLDDIARSTRVGRRHLEALETGDWAELPAPVFVKGFIRAYCEFLDASPDEALGLYREASGEPVKPERVQNLMRGAPSRACSRFASGSRAPSARRRQRQRLRCRRAAMPRPRPQLRRPPARPLRSFPRNSLRFRRPSQSRRGSGS
jgi:transcriptional regulator with XRE-family HTH domain